MSIDDPAVVAEIAAVFARYERALVDNDVAVLDALFWPDPRTIRYGIADMQHGLAEIAAFRRTQASGRPRDLERTVFTAFGRDLGTACTLFRRSDAPGQLGRQTQVWARLDGWRIVHAHVSMIDELA